MLRSWLQIQPAPMQSVSIHERMTFETNVLKNRIWYRGDGGELRDLYGQLSGGESRFWASVPLRENVRRIHSGLPAVMVDTLAYIVKSDLSEPNFGDGDNADWKNIAEELDFTELVGEAVKETLITGDGAFKISADSDVSKYPLCEFFPADRVEYRKERGRVTAVLFYTHYYRKSVRYTLEERYSKGEISYKLFKGEQEVPLETLPELKDLKPVSFSGDYMMAVPFKIYSSSKYPGRGKSIFDNKTDDFDAHDEVISQWLDAVRRGRVQRYIPEDMIPKDNKGNLLSISPFGADFIKVDECSDKEGNKQIQTVQPDINYQAYLGTYGATLDMCLQGILSPATLGIDLGKMTSADAQREKKDITGHTRNTITSALEKALPKLISALLMTYDHMLANTPGVYNPTVEFGEYGAPDFDSRVEVVNKAAAIGTMSIEAQVEELWGDSKEDDWKTQEIARIKAMKGLLEASPPALGDEMNDMG